MELQREAEGRIRQRSPTRRGNDERNAAVVAAMETRSLFWLAVASVIFAVQAMLVRLAHQLGGMPPTQLVFFRSMFQLFLMIVIMIFCREEEETEEMHRRNADILPSTVRRRLITVPFGRASQSGIVVLRGLTGGVAVLLYFFSVSTIPVGDAVTLMSLAPVFTVFLARATMGEPIQPTHLVAVALSVVGATAIAEPKLINFLHDRDRTSSTLVLGYAAALIGGFLNAVVAVAMRRAGMLGVRASQLVFSLSFFGALVSGASGWSASLGVVVKESPWRPLTLERSLKYVLPLCVVGASAMFLLNHAARTAPAGLASVVRSTTIGWGYLIEVAVFGKVPEWTTGAGAIAVFCALGLVAWERPRTLTRTLTRRGRGTSATVSNGETSDDEELSNGLLHENHEDADDSNDR